LALGPLLSKLFNEKNVAEFWQYFRNCLAESIHRAQSVTLLWLCYRMEVLTALVLLYSVARWCNAIQFFANVV